jgi:hypothetical protein
MDIIFLAPTLHPKPPITNPIPLHYAYMNNVNDNSGFPWNSWWSWSYVIGGARGNVEMIDLHTLGGLRDSTMCPFLHLSF